MARFGAFLLALTSLPCVVLCAVPAGLLQIPWLLVIGWVPLPTYAFWGQMAPWSAGTRSAFGLGLTVIVALVGGLLLVEPLEPRALYVALAGGAVGLPLLAWRYAGALARDPRRK